MLLFHCINFSTLTYIENIADLFPNTLLALCLMKAKLFNWEIFCPVVNCALANYRINQMNRGMQI
jgi:hypothetical protein